MLSSANDTLCTMVSHEDWSGNGSNVILALFVSPSIGFSYETSVMQRRALADVEQQGCGAVRHRTVPWMWSSTTIHIPSVNLYNHQLESAAVRYHSTVDAACVIVELRWQGEKKMIVAGTSWRRPVISGVLVSVRIYLLPVLFHLCIIISAHSASLFEAWFYFVMHKYLV